MTPFIASESFFKSVAKLQPQDRKNIKAIAFDLLSSQTNSSKPGFKLHRVEKAKDSKFWSARATKDLRIIIHQLGSHWVLCYVGHHDDAYRWAETRKIETHPTTGAVQTINLTEVNWPKPEPAQSKPPTERVKKPNPPLFANQTDEELLKLGVPGDLLETVKTADEDRFYDLMEHLPEEASEALFDLYNGDEPTIFSSTEKDPLKHPDTQRRFRVMENVEELQVAWESPWDQWTVFLHPSQRQLVERNFNGPAIVSGTAGTGKTVVAVHRAAHLARIHPDRKILILSFSKNLARDLETKLKKLIPPANPIFHNITITNIDKLALGFYHKVLRQSGVNIANMKRRFGGETADSKDLKSDQFNEKFLRSEWDAVVDAWDFQTFQDYKKFERDGRGRPLGSRQREIVWKFYEIFREKLAENNQITWSQIYGELEQHFVKQKTRPYDHIIIDEAQDLGPIQLKFVRSITAEHPNDLFFTGDLGQRIYKRPFPWLATGLEVRGRSTRLKVNYRTTHQIREFAEWLLPTEIEDVTGNKEKRSRTLSIFNGPQPSIHILKNAKAEKERIAVWLGELIKEGFCAEEIALVSRVNSIFSLGEQAVKMAGLTANVIKGDGSVENGQVSILTMHRAKGLEFRAIGVFACNEKLLPHPAAIEAADDETDRNDLERQEQNLFYVACTRARDQLLVTASEPASDYVVLLDEVSKA